MPAGSGDRIPYAAVMFTYLWKPLLRRAVVGRSATVRMRRGASPPFPQDMHRPGLYLHIPFCRRPCPFCPYNRTVYDRDSYSLYERAVHEEIDLVASQLASREAGSLYIGGGTPTVQMDGLLRLMDHIRRNFTLTGDTCIELHPSHMDDRCLQSLREANVTQVSIGVQSATDHLLERIGRAHSAATGLDAAKRAAQFGFDSVNTDLMFALPSQTIDEWDADLRQVLDRDVDQISAYPIFSFPYTVLGRSKGLSRVPPAPGRKVREMLDRADLRAGEYGLKRCAVWSWARPDAKRFSSVTRHHYIGFGPSAGSMTGRHFYVNTFDVQEYAASLPKRRPVALVMPVDRRMEMAYWLYWRLYELRAKGGDFAATFGPEASLEATFGTLLRPFQWLGWLNRINGDYRVTNSGAYWIHRLQNDFSLGYINRLWGKCREEAWPDEVIL